MAETAVRFLKEHVTQLLEYHSSLISGAEIELRQLIIDLDLLMAWSRHAEMNPDKNWPFGESLIKELVYKLEDVIDTGLTDVKSTNLWLHRSAKGHMIAGKVKDLRMRHIQAPMDAYLKISIHAAVKPFPFSRSGRLFVDLEDEEETSSTTRSGRLSVDVEDETETQLITGSGRLSVNLEDEEETQSTRMESIILGLEDEEETDEEETPSTSIESIFVGLEDEEETIIGYLTKPKDELDVISIIGTCGIGKTSLARRIYQNDRIAYDFPLRIWIHLSPYSKNRDVCLKILKMFSSQDMSSTSDQELTETVRACLEKEKFLLFLDGVCSHDYWKGIENILPHNNGKSKVLITSCQKHNDDGVVGKHGHRLRFLTTDESWKLLQLEVFGNLEDCPLELEGIGHSIAEKCGGLPLQIVVVGGILVSQLMKSNSLGLLELEWKKVLETDNLFLHNERSIHDSLELTYSTLHHDLRECFIYMGVFPKGYEISVWTLTRMWMAEGFIRLEVESGLSLEEIATKNLYDLIRRNLVMVDKVDSIGEVKTCRLHDTIRAFCTDKAHEQNLFYEIEARSKKGALNPQKCRRLCVRSNVDTLHLEVPKIERVRSFLCFYKELVVMDPLYISSIFDAFILLRVLESKIIKFLMFPTWITELIHLRYITLFVDDLHTLPQSMSELWNLQTLVIDTTSHIITIEADIWRLIWLRHVKTNAAIVLSVEGEGRAGENLQTLHALSPESCTEKVSERALNLKTLRIQGELPTLFKNKFLENLSRLEKLKLVNDSSPKIAYQNPLHGLPEPNCFPPNLRWLTLSNTFLKWNHMSTLAKINTLQVLKLKENAFTGVFWSVEDGFPSLQFLLMKNLDLVIWEASTDSLPHLRSLVLRNCKNLNEFPLALKSLEKLEVGHVNRSVVTSARRIAAQKAELGLSFNLSVAPG